MYKIFFSWQSDYPKNRSFIGDCLKTAAKRVGGIEIDNATRNTKGSVDIGASILAKIKVADAVVADVSIINPESDKRKTSNPNVLYELGYASAHHNFENLILVANKETTKGTGDLPFDIRNRNTTIIKFDKANKKRLTNEFVGIFSELKESTHNEASELSKPYIYLDRYLSGPQGSEFVATNDEDTTYVLTSIELGATEVRVSVSLAPNKSTSNIHVTEFPNRSLEYPIKFIRFTVGRMQETYRITQKISLQPRADERYNFIRIEPEIENITKIPKKRQLPDILDLNWNGDGTRVRVTDKEIEIPYNLEITGSLIATLKSEYSPNRNQIIQKLAASINDFYKGSPNCDFQFTTFNTNERQPFEELIDDILLNGAKDQIDKK